MRLVEVIGPPENLEKVAAIVSELAIKNFWPAGGKLDLAAYRILVEPEKSQLLLDALQGIKPRTWLGSEKARESSTVYIMIWLVSLAILIAIIVTTRGGKG